MFNFKRRVKQAVCRHEFKLSALTLTGIKPAKEPARTDCAGWGKYFGEADKHPSHKARVWWPCDKCGEGFYMHCGLDVHPTYGRIIPEEATT